MKKVLVVLLIAVLAMSAVFAAVDSFTGKLTTTLKYDIDNKEFGLTQSADVKGKFTFALFGDQTVTGSASGERYPYAVLEGNLALNFEDLVINFGDKGTTRYKAKDAFWEKGILNPETDKGNLPNNTYFTEYSLFDFAWSQKEGYKVFTKAAIVGENWELDLLKNFGVGNFAHDTVGDSETFKASTKVKKTVDFDFDNSTPAGDGVTFTYDGYKVAVNQFYFKPNESQFHLSLESKNFEFAEGASVTVGANLKDENNNFTANASAKVDYASEEVVASAATDVAIGLSGTNTNFDVSLSSSYLDGAFDADFYYASVATAKSPYSTIANLNKAVFDIKYDYTKDTATYAVKYKNKGDSVVGTAPQNVVVEKLMSAKASVDVAKLATLGEVTALSAAVDGHDMLHKDSDYYAFNAEVKGAMENKGFTAKVGAAQFTQSNLVRFYAETTEDFAKVAKLPVNTLSLTVGSQSILSERLVSGKAADRLYFTVESEINDAVEVKVFGKALIGENRTDKFGAEVVYTGVENLTVTGTVDHEFASISENKTNAAVKAEYEHELFTATAKAQTTLIPNTTGTFGLYAAAESDQIVDGATISLAYSELDDDGNVLSNWAGEKFDSFVAKCVISF